MITGTVACVLRLELPHEVVARGAVVVHVVAVVHAARNAGTAVEALIQSVHI